MPSTPADPLRDLRPHLAMIQDLQSTVAVLRWDQEAIGAAGVGLGLVSSVPVLGARIVYLFWGRNYVDTLGRFFASHVLLIPGLLIILMFFHFFMIRRHGIARPL